MSKPQRYSAPTGGRAVTPTGALTPGWQNYLMGLDEVSQRVAGPVEPLVASATLADVIAKVNELVAALETARLMKGE